MNLIDLTKKLINIPSFVDETNNESEVGDFIINYLQSFSFLKISKQEVEKKRFNIIAKDKYPTKVLITCHMDTVRPGSQWKASPLKPEIKNNKIYGLGSCDMKGGIACILDALKSVPNTKGLALLFYCDEEYDFKGVKKFIKEYSYKPDIIISPEATNLKIIDGFKGVIEIYFKVRGKSGHPARPNEGTNSIEKNQKIINRIKREVNRYKDPLLGPSLFNISYILGGLQIKSKNKVSVSNRGNNIPDIAETVIEIRTSDNKLNAKKIISIIKEETIKNSLSIEKIEIRSDLKPMKTSREKNKLIEGVKFGNLKKQGYFDGEIISKKFSAPFICFGPIGGNAHNSEEWVDISSLKKTRNIYKEIIEKNCK